jgi:Zn-finger protein
MSYSDWFEKHAKKHAKIMEKLKSKSDDEIIEYFRYENMQKNEPDFCPLYKQSKRCHEMKDLNCYLCACSNFKFNDEGFKKVDDKTLKSYCSIDSKDGSIFVGKDALHQDCSNCTVPHKKSFIKKVFKRDWLEIMKEVREG